MEEPLQGPPVCRGSAPRAGGSLLLCTHTTPLPPPMRHSAGTSSAPAQSHRALTCRSEAQKVLDSSPFCFWSNCSQHCGDGKASPTLSLCKAVALILTFDWRNGKMMDYRGEDVTFVELKSSLCRFEFCTSSFRWKVVDMYFLGNTFFFKGESLA